MGGGSRQSNTRIFLATVFFTWILDAIDSENCPRSALDEIFDLCVNFRLETRPGFRIIYVLTWKIAILHRFYMRAQF